MARLRSEIKEGILRCLWNAAQESTPLDDILNSFLAGGWNSIKTGKLTIASSGGGYSVSFNPPVDTSEVTQTEFFAFGTELIHIKADAVAALVAAGSATPTDDQVYAEMFNDDRFAGCREQSPDQTLLRWYYGPTR